MLQASFYCWHCGVPSVLPASHTFGQAANNCCSVHASSIRQHVGHTECILIVQLLVAAYADHCFCADKCS